MDECYIEPIIPPAKPTSSPIRSPDILWMGVSGLMRRCKAVVGGSSISVYLHTEATVNCPPGLGSKYTNLGFPDSGDVPQQP